MPAKIRRVTEVHGWIQNGFRYYLLIDTDDEE